MKRIAIIFYVASFFTMVVLVLVYGGEPVITKDKDAQIQAINKNLKELENMGGKHLKPAKITTSEIVLHTGDKLYLDSGGNDYIINASDGNTTIYSAGSVAIQTFSDQTVQFPKGIHIGGADGNSKIHDATAGSTSDTLYIGVNTIDTTAPSDIISKENIVDSTRGLTDILQLNVKEYNYKKKYVDDSNKKHIGLIAQEVQKVYPEAIINRSDGILAVDYKQLIPILINAIKELNARVEILENK